MTDGTPANGGAGADSALPPLKPLGAALYRTTELLAAELVRPTPEGPDWSDFEWRIAEAVAAMHGISPLLATRLRWHGPAFWQQFIHEQRSHTEERHRRIQALLASIDVVGRHHAVPILALKGAALHALGLYAPGERPMADVDLLVRPSDLRRTAQLLEELGFLQSETYWKHLTFTPRAPRPAHGLGEHSDNDIKIELHERIGEILPSRITDLTGSIFPAHASPGLNPYPSNAALMLHLLLHAAGALQYRSLRMLHLHDIAQLAGRMTENDWNEVLRPGGIDRCPWWALPPLTLVARYYPAAVPPRVLSALAPSCPWRLRWLARHRTLTDVSLSYLWLEAFPGLEWAPSTSEMLEYAATRTLKAVSLLLRLQASAVQPGTNPPMQFSRRPYILRWLVARQARPETISAVRAALAQL